MTSDLAPRDGYPGELDLLKLGWHSKLSMDLYLADPGVSSSILKLQGEAPALAKAALDRTLDNGDTQASMEGELIHTALLEPDDLEARYVVGGDCEAELGSGLRKGQACGAAGHAIHPDVGWVCGRHGAKHLDPPRQVVVNSAQMRMAFAIRDNALIPGRPLHHPAAKQLLQQAGEAELTGIFTDPETGERGRIRLDRWLELGWSLDVKTVDVGRGHANKFVRHAWNRGMHVQQGWYRHGAHVLDREVARHVILVAERGYPYLVQPYLLPPELVTAGEQEALANLRALAHCRETGEWPGYSTELVELELLGWQKAQLQKEPAERAGAEEAASPDVQGFGLFD